MSANLYQRLTRLLPTPSTLVGQVVAQHPTDDTSTVQLPAALAAQPYAPGVAVGSTITARGRTVPVGDYAFVRDGTIVAQAPTGIVSDVVIGVVAALPFGPARLAAAALPTTLRSGTVGAPYDQSVSSAATGGYPPITYTLASGTLPAGLTLSAAGQIAGTPSAAVTSSLVLTITDTTRRSVTSAAVSLTIAP